MRFRIVNQNQLLVVEKFGKFNRLGESGINILKFGEKVVANIDLRTQIIETSENELITKDSVTLVTDAVIYFKIVDVMKAVYNVQDYKQAMVLLVGTTLRNEVAKMKMEEALSKKDELNANLALSIDEATSEWGLKVERVEIKDMKPSKKMTEAMEKERVAELEKKALLTEVQGRYDKEVKEAEGKKRSRVLNSEAEKEEAIQKADAIRTLAEVEVDRIKMLAEARAEELRLLGEIEASNAKLMLESLKEAGADEKVIRLKYIEAMLAMANGENKVFFPYNEDIGLSQVGVLSEMSEPTNKEVKETVPTVDNTVSEEKTVEDQVEEIVTTADTVASVNSTVKEAGANVKDMMAKGIGVVKGLKRN